MFEAIFGFLSDYTYRTVIMGSALLGLSSGVLGSFAVLRKQSLLGDAVSHAALPGVALAFLITGSKKLPVMLLGAFVAGLLATLFINAITRRSRIKDDSALGLVLSVFFGLGLVLLTIIQKMPNAGQSGLEKFLFGQAATLVINDVIVMAIASLVLLTCVILFWKEFKLLTFDPGYCQSLGFPVRLLDNFLTVLLVVAIIIGLQTVGVVLMSAMIVAPVAAARQWTDRMWVMVTLSALFGATAGISGALTSSLVKKMPTGPTIILWVSGIVVFSMLFAPNRGLLWRYLRDRSNRKQIQERAVLEDFFELFRQHGTAHGHSIDVLRLMSLGHGGVDGSIVELEDKGLIYQPQKDHWTLTKAGIERARELFETEADT